jgi:hypothetical protein
MRLLPVILHLDSVDNYTFLFRHVVAPMTAALFMKGFQHFFKGWKRVNFFNKQLCVGDIRYLTFLG